MVRLWQRMGEIYGHKWVSGYGEALTSAGDLSQTAETWLIGLSGVTGEQFASGLEICVKSGEAWPPTLPEFREMCLGKKKNEFGLNYVPECYRKQPERKRERLLSSDSRDAKRKELSKRICDLRALLN